MAGREVVQTLEDVKVEARWMVSLPFRAPPPFLGVGAGFACSSLIFPGLVFLVIAIMFIQEYQSNSINASAAAIAAAATAVSADTAAAVSTRAATISSSSDG